MSTWEELAQRDSADVYFVFRGAFASGAAVRWATSRPRFLSPALDPRMSIPASIVAGMPETLAASPERVSTSIVLDNTDGALTDYFAGGADTTTAYEGDSFLNLTGQIFLGIADADGTTQEQAVTPTLCVVGSPSTNGTQITLPLSSDDADILGPSKKMIPIAELFGDRTEQVTAGDICAPDGTVTAGYFTAGKWRNVRTHPLKPEGYAPWLYGKAAFPLTLVLPQGPVGGQTYLVGITASQPEISDWPNWQLFGTSYGPGLRKDSPAVATLVRQEFTYTAPDGTATTAWMLLVDFFGNTRQFEADDRFYVIPSTGAHLGMPAGLNATPSNIIKRIVTDLSDGGAAGIDSASFTRASLDVPILGAFGGSLRSDAAIAEVLSHISGATGLSLWHGADDRLHIQAQGAWNASDVTAAAAAPDLRECDVMEGTWSERIPSGDERGAAATRVSVEWPNDMGDFWPPEMTRTRAPGLTRLEMREENEARISGAWVLPSAADRALVEVGGRRRHVYRRISFVTHAWVAARGIGSMVRVTHRWGMAAGGYVRRLLRLVRYEMLPGEMAARCEWEDLDALERQRIGVLDSIDNWVKYRGNGNGVTVDAFAGTTTVTASSAIFDGTMKDCSLWTPNAANANDRSRRIVGVTDSTHVEVDRPYVDDMTAKADTPCAAVDEQWLILLNRNSTGGSYRPDYICLCDEETGVFTDSTAGFTMA